MRAKILFSVIIFLLAISLLACNNSSVSNEEATTNNIEESSREIQTTAEESIADTTENITEKQSEEAMTDKVLEESLNNETTTEEITDGREEIDLFLFIGQSNMAGRGNSSEAIKVQKGHAYEYRAISSPNRLFRLAEPFGSKENNEQSGVSEALKSGSLVSAFCESYYAETGVPIVAVSCSKGGTMISFWDIDGAPYADAVERMRSAIDFIDSQGDMKIRHIFVLWLQGESDGDNATDPAEYIAALTRIFDEFEKDFGAEHFFVIPIGAYNGDNDIRNANYTAIREAQTDFCDQRENATVVSTVLYGLRDAGYMKDEFHFTQAGYNVVGSDAGKNTGYFVRTGEIPECENYTE